jgi:predicted ester cyclase
MATDIRDISRRVFEEIWNNKNLNAADEVIASDYVHHDAQSPPVPDGIDGYKEFVSHYLNAFPDLRFTIEDQISDGQTIVSRGQLPARITETCLVYPAPAGVFQLLE